MKKASGPQVPSHSKTTSFFKFVGAVLTHPVVAILAMALGVYIGATHQELASKMARPGAIYLGLLQMCVIPIMIAAVTLSVGNLLRSQRAQKSIIMLGLVFAMGMGLASGLGIVTGLIGRPGKGLATEQKAVLGKQIAKAEVGADHGVSTGAKPQEKVDFFWLVNEMIPRNVFLAISEGRALAVLFFCIVLGTALGTLQSASSDVALAMADALYESLLKVMAWLLYGLPIGLCCLFADAISQIGPQVFSSLFKLMILTNLAAVLLVFVYSIVIWIRSGQGYWASLTAMRRALFVALGTSSSMAAIPFALEGLQKRLRFDKELVDLVIPLGTSLNPHGNILCFSLMAVFMAQLYDSPLNVRDLFAIFSLSIAAGVAASSAPGLAALSMISFVLQPLGLPPAVGIILLAALNIMVDPMLTVVNLYGNCASTALIAEKQDPLDANVRFASGVFDSAQLTGHAPK